jgi:hypothetical protein
MNPAYALTLAGGYNGGPQIINFNIQLMRVQSETRSARGIESSHELEQNM